MVSSRESRGLTSSSDLTRISSTLSAGELVPLGEASAGAALVADSTLSAS